ncbi:MAG: hypothetical protein JNL25_10160 [Rhodospirillaceae bacterium]|nr:hypothetical protein [Rhodospirillaceae bacterium]
MADIGRILYLPPPLQPAAAPSSAAPGQNAKAGRSIAPTAGETIQRGVVAAIDGDPGASAGGRSKQFRFRVYDGSRPDEALAGDNGLPTRRTPTSRTGAAQEETTTRGRASLDAPSGEAARGGPGSNPGTGLATPSSAFLAQLIAQEQLRPGLHDPPLRDADLAYRRAGGEPALGAEAGGPFRARFKLAV